MNQTLKSFSNIDNISISSTINLEENKLNISFLLVGALENYIFPQKSEEKRADELWKATSFEFFLANSQSEEYYELNFSSSLAWNFYHLEEYGADVQELKDLAKPKIEVFNDENEFKITFELEGFNFKEFDLYNVACILLTKENERTFWSVKHQLSVPDFHKRQNFLRIL